MRRYQRAWDPSAYFLQVWLPSLSESQRRGVTADWLRHPARPLNVALETILVAADQALDEQDHERAETLLEAVNAVLDAGGDLNADPLAADYLALALAASENGYQAQRIALDAEAGAARVLVSITEGADTLELAFDRRSGEWLLVSLND